MTDLSFTDAVDAIGQRCWGGASVRQTGRHEYLVAGLHDTDMPTAVGQCCW